MSSKTCAKCSAYIPNGRTYCTAHYQEALQEYEEDLERYHANYQQYLINVENWNNMSVEERNLHHKAAESSSLGTISVITALVIGGGVWFVFKDQWEWWISASITAGLVFLFSILKKLIGKIVRGLLAGIFWGIGLTAAFFGATWALANWGEIGFVIELTNDQDMMVMCLMGTLAFGLLVCVIKEIKGDHHAYGGPVEPSRPSAPSP